ncbi:hypothetical protein AAUPMC_10164 [Pasteurella multocida subsp. multocida str. Anand1_cattle]|nr:hypothetical protein AAUPMC_10164 [Pasteurella multocida subsp. multocida str. Anand1_cattle]
MLGRSGYVTAFLVGNYFRSLAVTGYMALLVL